MYGFVDAASAIFCAYLRDFVVFEFFKFKRTASLQCDWVGIRGDQRPGGSFYCPHGAHIIDIYMVASPEC